MMKSIYKILLLALVFTLGSCNKFLDIVPDNVPSIDNAFTLRNSAEKYLFTCYSYMPLHGDPTSNPAFYASGELWTNSDVGINIHSMRLGKGFQNSNAPILNAWDGSPNQKSLFVALRDCNIFLENISKVQEMTDGEKAQWAAEVKFLKAYYHFYLMRMYGPIPLIRENISIDASKDEVDVMREPIDDCVDYIVQLLDEAIPNLPPVILNEGQQLGRVTQPIALSVKALVLATAASPLYNGNADYAGFKDKTGRQLFNTTYSAAKWTKAVTACEEAITACHSVGMKLYDFNQEIIAPTLAPGTRIKMSIRNSVAKRWNTETIWATTISTTNQRTRTLELGSQARLDGNAVHQTGSIQSDIAPTLAMAEMYYSKNGVPITEDKNWNFANRFNLRTSAAGDFYDLAPNNTTVELNFDREPRYYASLGFDGGEWFGQAKLDDKAPWYVSAKYGQYSGRINATTTKYSITGFWPKKMVNYENAYIPTSNYTGAFYPFPVMRLADLYLLHAEAVNEASGPIANAFTYLNPVRQRAGLPTVQTAWSNFSTNPTKYTTKEGLREIIQQERALELAFEAHRFWDLRRWKLAIQVLNNQPVRGFDVDQVDAVNYYREKNLFTMQFGLRDYFWPIKQENLIVNKNLVQNPGW